MCVRMDYSHTPIVSMNTKYMDDATQIFSYNPIHLHVHDVDSLHIINEMVYQYKTHRKYDDTMYMMGTFVSIYGIYYFAVQIIESIYK
jgi:hypothetical protein